MKGKSAFLPACLSVSLAVRLWGMKQGYPEFYGHVDEIGVAASIWNFFRSGTLLPTEFTYPAFFSYLSAAVLWLTCWIGLTPRAGGCFDSLVFTSFVDPAWEALVGRFLSAVAGTATVWLTHLIGRRAFGSRVGGVAALMVAFAVVPVGRAHAALPDSTMALLAAVCFYFSWMIYERGAWKDYLWAGIFAGWVVATKYNGAFIAFSIVAAHWMRRREKGAENVRLGAAVLVSFAALFAGSPYLFLAREKYLAVAGYQVSSLDFSMGETRPWWWIVESFPRVEYGIGGLMMGGVVLAAWKRHPFDVLFLSAWIPSFLYIGSWTRESLHYLLHFYPLLAVEAARLLMLFLARIGKGRDWTVLGVASLCALPSFWQIVRSDVELTLPDIRSQTAAWIEGNLPGGTRLAMTWLPYCPRLALVSARRSVAEYYRDKPELLERLQRIWRRRPAYELVNLEIWLKRPVVPRAYLRSVDLEDPETRRIFSRGWLSPAQLRKRGVEYVVLPEAAYERYLRGSCSASPGSAAHYHFFKNRAYFSALLSPDNPEVEQVAYFPAGSHTRGSGIRILHIRPLSPKSRESTGRGP